MTDKATMFKPMLAYLRSTLQVVAPVIKEIVEQNHELGRPKEELEWLVRKIEEGQKLVSKCSKISRWNLFARLHQQEQLVALVDSLMTFFMIDMQVQAARDLRETLLKVRRIHSAVVTGVSSSGSAPVPEEVSGCGSSQIQDSPATKQAENAMGTESTEQVKEDIRQETEDSYSDSDIVAGGVSELETLHSRATQPAENVDEISSAEQVMEPSLTPKDEAGGSMKNCFGLGPWGGNGRKRRDDGI